MALNAILVACEESQVVTKAFRDIGIVAFSCDLQENSGPFPEWHIKGDVVKIIEDDWRAVIAFPPCTYLTNSANKWYKDQPPRKSGALVGAARRAAREDAVNFFMLFTKLKCPWAIENPIGVMNSRYRKPDQVIQPWMFGHDERKSTCLWLHKLPILRPTKIARFAEPVLHRLRPTKNRSMIRSKTYQGVADAMAKQWEPYV